MPQFPTIPLMMDIAAQIQGLLKRSRIVDLVLPLVISASILIFFVPLPETPGPTLAPLRD